MGFPGFSFPLSNIFSHTRQNDPVKNTSVPTTLLLKILQWLPISLRATPFLTLQSTPLHLCPHWLASSGSSPQPTTSAPFHSLILAGTLLPQGLCSSWSSLPGKLLLWLPTWLTPSSPSNLGSCRMPSMRFLSTDHPISCWDLYSIPTPPPLRISSFP